MRAPIHGTYYSDGAVWIIWVSYFSKLTLKSQYSHFCSGYVMVKQRPYLGFKRVDVSDLSCRKFVQDILWSLHFCVCITFDKVRHGVTSEIIIHIINNNNNEYNVHFVFRWRHRGIPSMQSSYSAEIKQNGICMEERRVHCKCIGQDLSLVQENTITSLLCCVIFIGYLCDEG